MGLFRKKPSTAVKVATTAAVLVGAGVCSTVGMAIGMYVVQQGVRFIRSLSGQVVNR